MWHAHGIPEDVRSSDKTEMDGKEALRYALVHGIYERMSSDLTGMLLTKNMGMIQPITKPASRCVCTSIRCDQIAEDDIMRLTVTWPWWGAIVRIPYKTRPNHVTPADSMIARTTKLDVLTSVTLCRPAFRSMYLQNSAGHTTGGLQMERYLQNASYDCGNHYRMCTQHCPAPCGISFESQFLKFCHIFLKVMICHQVLEVAIES